MNEPIGVLVVDDQAVVRAALRAVIDRRDRMRVLGEAADGAEAVAAAYELRPDVIVMDVRMPEMTGVEACRRILADWQHPPPPRILILTTFDLDEYVHAALRAGAAGFLLKNSRPEKLTEAITVVAEGESMLAPSVTQRLIRSFASLPTSLTSGHPAAGDAAEGGRGLGPGDAADGGRVPGPDPARLLTARELEVLALLARGEPNVAIAATLGVTEATVKSRVNRILTRLGLANRVQAAILAHDAGLVDRPRPHAPGAGPGPG
ncbi:DNA-binding NarL/FixJ family response regulator [Murinocardiopsis flavida]|uniref:DNA-binding NarL/FixJ family response regulator n=1 Tax=Murinocardiopsis flavida TaxID=645275 RepID=A0A2P8D3G4_9ACTN|nr:response regulator transcription factor [Murinocardiopsis flavida]PSK91761.1 DNA-binding NarL/FixJ family response regulator [Murinocardiopsis flavida]